MQDTYTEQILLKNEAQALLNRTSEVLGKLKAIAPEEQHYSIAGMINDMAQMHEGIDDLDWISPAFDADDYNFTYDLGDLE